ncbi:MAG: exosortase-associated EpsI family protein [Planctomycetaceae bacterium]|nr:exosortase-associated EpsI family protein [Planctomycetaceae bacterium]
MDNTNFSRRELLLCAGGIGMMSVGALMDRLLNHPTGSVEQLQAAAGRLLQVPSVIGEWTSTDQEIDPRERRMADIIGGLRREYVHHQTGYVATMTLLSGTSGAMSVHPPTTCFEGVGYSLLSGPAAVTFPAGAEETVTLNRAIFARPQKTLTDLVRVFWGWSRDGKWDAPASPRIAYRDAPGLYKLYVVDRLPAETVELPQAEVFLRDAVPVLRQVLGGASSVSGSAAGSLAFNRREGAVTP